MFRVCKNAKKPNSNLKKLYFQTSEEVQFLLLPVILNLLPDLHLFGGLLLYCPKTKKKKISLVKPKKSTTKSKKTMKKTNLKPKTNRKQINDYSLMDRKYFYFFP